MRKLAPFLCLLISLASFSQTALLQSGPMLGYCEMTEVLLWVQTKESATVHVNYWEDNVTVVKMVSEKKITSQENAFTTKLILTGLKPGTKYLYDLYINQQKVTFAYPTTFQTKVLWEWRASAPDFTVALGSCTYVNEPEVDRPGRSYGSGYEIFTSIYHAKPDLMLWMGDNIYLREADYNSKSGIYHRYTHARGIKELQPLLATAQNIAIWDDHDFGPNDSDRSFYLKHISQQAFKDFWGNKTYGMHPNQTEGVFSVHAWGDAEFYLLDNRFFRSPNDRKTGDKTLLGKEQLQWLIDALSGSKANFKIICIGGQTLNTAATFENYANYAEERAALLEEITKNQITGVLFLSGDRHFSELSQWNRKDAYPLFDWTVSPLTSGVSKSAEKENNQNKVPGSLFQQHAFGLMQFSGDKNNRKITLLLQDKEGKNLWKKEISLSELK